MRGEARREALSLLGEYHRKVPSWSLLCTASHNDGKRNTSSELSLWFTFGRRSMLDQGQDGGYWGDDELILVTSVDLDDNNAG